jgi:threonine dehydrogenase-like Zn-dependent dehydrogenase
MFTGMRAMSVIPGQPGSALAQEVPEPPESDGPVLVDGLLAGICGTDIELIAGFGQPPPGRPRLVLGHESLGRVVQAPPDAGVAPGDLVVGIVRRPDPVPCAACAAGQWDFCGNGRYTERGIKALDGYGARRWRVEPGFAVPVPASLGERGVLTEPASVVAKAWEQIERIRGRGPAAGRTALITGAGPVGLLAALIGMQRGYQVHVLDQMSGGPKPRLVAGLGASYHHGAVAGLDLRADVVIECTGAGGLVVDLAGKLARSGVICLVGLSAGPRGLAAEADPVNDQIVLENVVIFGTVSAARRNYVQAVRALARADPDWLDGLITRRVPLRTWPDALARRPDDVKVTVDLTD